MAALVSVYPDMTVLVISGGLLAGLLAGSAIGAVNGVGIALFGVSPFMMTLGLTSVGFGIALYLTSGLPVYGMPDAFGSVLGFGSMLGIPVPIYVTFGLIAVIYFILNCMTIGRYFYAVGGNANAARLSGIDTRSTLMLAYVICSALTTVSSLMLTARLATGEANIDASSIVINSAVEISHFSFDKRVILSSGDFILNQWSLARCTQSRSSAMTLWRNRSAITEKISIVPITTI
jgi:ribose transport system permease protein